MRLLTLTLLIAYPVAHAQETWTEVSEPPCEAIAELYSLADSGFEGMEADTLTSARSDDRVVVVSVPRLNLIDGSDPRLTYESWGGDISNDYSVTLSGLSVNAGPDPNQTATRLLMTASDSVAACLGDGFKAWPPGRGGVVMETRWDTPHLSSAVTDEQGGRMFGPSIKVYAIGEAVLADALEAEASPDAAELFSTYEPSALVEQVDRIVLRLQIEGGRQ